MCDSRRPLNGADSSDLFINHTPCIQRTLPDGNGDPYWCSQHDAFWFGDRLHCTGKQPTGASTYPVWPTRAANDGWDQPEVPPSARALVGAGARGGE